jgi:hypothetical protein
MRDAQNTEEMAETWRESALTTPKPSRAGRHRMASVDARPRGETGTRFAPSQKSDKKGIFFKFRNPNLDHSNIYPYKTKTL